MFKNWNLTLKNNVTKYDLNSVPWSEGLGKILESLTIIFTYFKCSLIQNFIFSR